MEFIRPRWAAPDSVRAFSSTRHGGVSTGAYGGLNLALHVADDPAHVAINRERLYRGGELPSPPRWPTQCHGTHAVHAAELTAAGDVVADAVYSDTPGLVCAILTADCLPLVVCSLVGDEVAVIHAGWRGLLDGIIDTTLARFATSPARLAAWIGPGISAAAYAVDEAFRARFLDADPATAAIFSRRDGQLYADLPRLAEMRLGQAGISRIARYPGCTYRESARLFSYRRDGITGRFATCAWIENPAPSDGEAPESA